jgi:hypothetical protein
VVANILRWSGNGLLVLLLSVILVIASFRLAASIRETGARPNWRHGPATWCRRVQAACSCRRRGPEDGIPVVLFHGTAAWSELWRHTSDVLAGPAFT